MNPVSIYTKFWTVSKTKKGVKPLGFHTFYYLLINYYLTSSKSAS